ncbi:MAG: hypothetical protein NT178_12015 [Proteobacteria bacterium]|nr:hypothetical protein [Pseudomonadota bacterium]
MIKGKSDKWGNMKNSGFGSYAALIEYYSNQPTEALEAFLN